MAETEFPGAWQNLPPDARRFLVERCRDWLLEQHEGPAGLIRWLYAGKVRPDGSRAPYAGTADYYWSLVLEDVAQWQQDRQRSSLAAIPPAEG